MPQNSSEKVRHGSCLKSRRPKLASVFGMIGSVLVSLIVLAALVWLGGQAIRWKLTASVREFRAKGTEHHAQVARACEELVSQLRSSGEVLANIEGTNQAIPHIIQLLRPQRIQVAEDMVSIQAAEPTRGGFAVVWQRRGTNELIWDLTAGTELGFRQLYSKTNGTVQIGN
jgi:hypothetical protein